MPEPTDPTPNQTARRLPRTAFAAGGVVVVGIEAIAGAKILSAWLPFEVWEIGLGLMLVMTAVNLMSARSYGEFEFWFSSLKVAAILVFIAIAGAYVLGLAGRPDPDANHLVAHGGFAPHGWLAALSGVVSVIFALTGAEIATIAAADRARADRPELAEQQSRAVEAMKARYQAEIAPAAAQ